MKKLFTIFFLTLLSFNVSAALVFTGSLYMLDAGGSPAFDNTTQCSGCDASIGEIDKSISTIITGNSAIDIIGNHSLLDVDLDWSMTNLSYIINQDSTISISGNFLWTNYNGLTTSTFSQLSEPLGPYGEITALDGDFDGIKGNALIDGPFQGYSLFLEGAIVSTVPAPAAVWLFGSGLIGLVSFARRKKA